MPFVCESSLLVCLLVGTIFFYGLVFGSFFNVLIYRLPRGESVIFPASHCPNCNHKLSWSENIPLFSFLYQRGKCKKCKTKISLQYPLIELITGIYSLLLLLIFRDKILWAMSGEWWNCVEIFLQYFTLLLFIPLAVIDVKHYIIPDELTLPGIAFALAVSFLPDGITPLQSITGSACGGGFLLLTGLAGKLVLKREDAMGGGDVKFLLWLGALFGFEAALITIFAGCAVGAFVSIILISLKKAKNGKIIPFCPYLCVGMLIFTAFGKEILSFF